jgi:hypothetical protein
VLILSLPWLTNKTSGIKNCITNSKERKLRVNQV